MTVVLATRVPKLSRRCIASAPAVIAALHAHVEAMIVTGMNTVHVQKQNGPARSHNIHVSRYMYPTASDATYRHQWL